MLKVKQKLTGNLSTNSKLSGNLSYKEKFLPPKTQEKTITPSKNDQQVIPDENYTGLSKVVVKAVTSNIDSNIIPENIKDGTTILGVEGTLIPLSSNDSLIIFSNYNEDGYPTKAEITSKSTRRTNNYLLSSSTTNYNQYFNYIEEVILSSNIEMIGGYCFYNLKSLKTINMQNIKRIYGSAFMNSGLEEIELSENFLSFNVGNNFQGCNNLKKVIIYSTTIPLMENTSTFLSTPIANGDGYIYVVDSLVDSYKSATNWSTYANKIKPISELEE